jgi:uncharacterized phage protein (TIGR01671 family)
MREIKFKLVDTEKNEIVEYINCSICIDGEGIQSFNRDGEIEGTHLNKHLLPIQYTGLKDKDGKEIYEGDVVELTTEEIGIRRFVVKIETVVREVVSHPNFIDETAKVAITGVVFEWNGYKLFPCVDEDGISDNEKMRIVGNIYENHELIQQGGKE